MRLEPRPHPERVRKPAPKKWLTCPACFKCSLAESLGKIRHYRGCRRSRAWHREALTGADKHR